MRSDLCVEHWLLSDSLLSDCSITEEGYKALASALRSNPSHLIELDLTGNDPGQSGVKELSDLLQDPNCQLKTLRFLGPAADEACQFLGPAADEACQYVTGIVGKNPLLLRELNLSGRELGDTRVNQIAALLQDKHCQLNTLDLCRCSITEKQCLILTSALKSNPSHLRELNLSRNKLGDSGVKNLSDLLMNTQFKLEKLVLCDCSITEKQCLILTSALKSNPSHLRELNLSFNKLGDSGVKNLSDLLMNTQFKLEKLDLYGCGITDVSSLTQSLTNTKALQFLKELDLNENKIGDSKQQLIDVLRDSNCKLIAKYCQFHLPYRAFILYLSDCLLPTCFVLDIEFTDYPCLDCLTEWTAFKPVFPCIHNIRCCAKHSLTVHTSTRGAEKLCSSGSQRGKPNSVDCPAVMGTRV
ncbi:Ribonuclease inhibitor [Labeo rohita]|uniref:Ribonuclease inhibitor n=1 Tax=Labeo rohita TaxID=84645 RepID=A0ABQ8L991_LABRO|nr:Ribonuclease inhibitor [Labeo rohita]